MSYSDSGLGDQHNSDCKTATNLQQRPLFQRLHETATESLQRLQTKATAYRGTVLKATLNYRFAGRPKLSRCLPLYVCVTVSVCLSIYVRGCVRASVCAYVRTYLVRACLGVCVYMFCMCVCTCGCRYVCVCSRVSMCQYECPSVSCLSFCLPMSYMSVCVSFFFFFGHFQSFSSPNTYRVTVVERHPAILKRSN